MQLKFISLTVDDQQKALQFYTSVMFEVTCGNLIQLVQPHV